MTGCPERETSSGGRGRHRTTYNACILNTRFTRMVTGKRLLISFKDTTISTAVVFSLQYRVWYGWAIRVIISTWAQLWSSRCSINLDKSYLTDRKQFVQLWSSSSVINQCPCGVPQGFVLGPLLHAAYISPTSNVALQFGVGHHQYAEDTHMTLHYLQLISTQVFPTYKNVSQLYAYVSVRMVWS